jgi:hypothetical protein
MMHSRTRLIIRSAHQARELRGVLWLFNHWVLPRLREVATR